MEVDDVTDLMKSISDDQPKAITEFGDTFFSSNTDVSDEYKNYFTQLTLTSSLIGTVKLLESFRDEDLREDEKNIDLPVYGIHVTNVAACPIENYELLEQTMPNHHQTRVSDLGHA